VSVDLRPVAARVTEGDVAAFRQIVDHTRAPLYRLAARLMGNLLDAEDVLQDAYVNAYRGLVEGRYDGRSKVETWLYRIVANASVDALRKRRPRSAEASDEARFDGLVHAETRVALGELDALLATLAPQDRAAIVLVAVEGLSVKAAADMLECSEGAVEQRLVRARASLRIQREGREVTDG
jgi:RNA polymerase sigma-70 factor, ECF subfamily